MEYTPDQLQLIRDKRPELKLLIIPSLDAVIVEFLKKFEVYVQPITSNTTNRGESAVAGAITGMVGADVGGDAFMISAQKKQTAVIEWTIWKQWSLDHKDFSALKEKKIDKPKAHNLEILNKPEIQKEIENLLKNNKVVKELNKIENEYQKSINRQKRGRGLGGLLGFPDPNQFEKPSGKDN